MRLTDLRHRVNRLEGRNGTSSAVLQFADGGSLAITPHDPLGLLLDGMRRTHARDMNRPVPECRNGKLLDAIERAETVTAEGDPLFELIHNILHSEVRR